MKENTSIRLVYEPVVTSFLKLFQKSISIAYIPLSIRSLIPYKEKKLPVSSQNSFLFFLLQNKPILALINWVFQGMRGMGLVDLTGKICLEILFFSVSLIFLNGPLTFRSISAFLIAHTLNWLFNCHFWVLGRYLGLTRTNPARFPEYLSRLVKRLDDCRAIDPVIVIGGASRNKGISPTSDVDIFFVRSPGFRNGITAAIITVKERALAFIYRFPLHLLLYDKIEMMNRHRKDEIPFLLKDNQGLALGYYSAQYRRTAGFEDYREEATKTA